jgi:putative sterol carrier protein
MGLTGPATPGETRMNIDSAVAGPAADLRHWLGDFQTRFNSNTRAAKLAKGWDRQILLESTDSAKRYTMLVRDAQLREVINGGPPDANDEGVVTLRANEGILSEIFSGNYNPSTALLDGVLEVYSDARDKVKLEALAMVIWGL